MKRPICIGSASDQMGRSVSSRRRGAGTSANTIRSTGRVWVTTWPGSRRAAQLASRPPGPLAELPRHPWRGPPPARRATPRHLHDLRTRAARPIYAESTGSGVAWRRLGPHRRRRSPRNGQAMVAPEQRGCHRRPWPLAQRRRDSHHPFCVSAAGDRLASTPASGRTRACCDTVEPPISQAVSEVT